MKARHEPLKTLNEWSEREKQARDAAPGRMKLAFLKLALTSMNSVAELLGRATKLQAQRRLITNRRLKIEDRTRRNFRYDATRCSAAVHCPSHCSMFRVRASFPPRYVCDKCGRGFGRWLLWWEHCVAPPTVIVPRLYRGSNFPSFSKLVGGTEANDDDSEVSSVRVKAVRAGGTALPPRTNTVKMTASYKDQVIQIVGLAANRWYGWSSYILPTTPVFLNRPVLYSMFQMGPDEVVRAELETKSGHEVFRTPIPLPLRPKLIEPLLFPVEKHEDKSMRSMYSRCSTKNTFPWWFLPKPKYLYTLSSVPHKEEIGIDIKGDSVLMSRENPYK